jgi:cytochrome c biogenesis protein
LKNTSLGRLYELLSSMRFAVSLLSVLGIASVIGTVLKQNEPYASYVVQLGQFWFTQFDLLGLFDVYHSSWFLLILLFLVLSTSLCVYRNTPSMLRELRSFREHATEISLRNFSHRSEYRLSVPLEEATRRLGNFLVARGFRYRSVAQADGSLLLAAKAGSYQRLGYILTHSAIVLICLGGLLDGNLPFKLQELLGVKTVEMRDIPRSQVPPQSRLSVANLSFRANMTLAEGEQGAVAFMRMRDGYLVQELPFQIALKDFRMEQYATGQPKLFESDVEIIDPARAEPLRATIRVNHPLIYHGIAIYQSDFQDGGSALDFAVWPLTGPSPAAGKLHGRVFDDVQQGALSVELDDFKLFNVLDLSADGKGKPHNVGPSVTFKVRDSQGQAHEYLNYMQPLMLDGHAYFVSGMRAAQNDDYSYLRIPADAAGTPSDFMHLRAIMQDATQAPQLARRVTARVLSGAAPAAQAKFESSMLRLVQAFAADGFTGLAKLIEKAVPAQEQDQAADAYLRMLGLAAHEALLLSREAAALPPPAWDAATQRFLRDSLNAINDLAFYGAPFFLELSVFEQRQASGFQLTRSPGKNLVYGGSLLLVLGIFAMIYVRERRIWLLLQPGTQRVLFAMSANRKGRDFEIEFARYREQLQALL